MKDQSVMYHFLAIVACLLWSSAFVAAKYAIEYLPPLWLAGIRFVLAGLLLIPLCKGWRKPFKLIREHFGMVFAVGFFHTIYLYAVFFYAMTMVRGAQAAIMIGAGPLVSAVVAHLLMKDDRLTPRTMMSLCCGLGGIVLLSLSAEPWSPVGRQEFWGLLLLLSGCVVSAVGNVTVAKLKQEVSAIVLCSAQMMVGGMALLIAGFFVNGAVPWPTGFSFYLALLWLAIISATGFSIWFFLLKRIRVSRLNLWKFIIPLSGAILSWVFIPGEAPSWMSVAGMLCIVAGVILGQLERA